jgi:hypothetical protein
LFACLAAFCVSRSTNLDAGADVIDFDSQCFEHDEQSSGFNLTTDTFTPRVSGLYWLHFTAGLPDTGELTEVQLALPTRTINILRGSEGPTVTSCRSELVSLTVDIDRLHLSSEAGLFSNASDARVSWSGFYLDPAMSAVAFSVALSESHVGTGTSYIPFDVVLVDTHSGWQSNRYNIRFSGLWVITLHVGDALNPISGAITELYLQPGFFNLVVTHQFTGDRDMVSITAVLNASAGDFLGVVASSIVYSDINYQTSMMGFLYSPSAWPAVAWTVTIDSTQRGPLDPALFGTVIVNEGNGFDVITLSRFIAPHAGLYYVSMTGTGVTYMKMELLHNGIMKAAVHTDYSDLVTRSRAIILRLNVGNELRVRVPAGYALFFGSNGPSNVFTGFRLTIG